MTTQKSKQRRLIGTLSGFNSVLRKSLYGVRGQRPMKKLCHFEQTEILSRDVKISSRNRIFEKIHNLIVSNVA